MGGKAKTSTKTSAKANSKTKAKSEANSKAKDDLKSSKPRVPTIGTKKVDKLKEGDQFKQGDRTRGTMVYEVIGAPVKGEDNMLTASVKILSATKAEKEVGKKEELHFQQRLKQWKTVEMVGKRK